MKKNWLLAIICILILSGCGTSNTSNQEVIYFQYEHTGEYLAVTYEDKMYVPYCAGKRNMIGDLLGYIEGKENIEIYRYLDYPAEEWIVDVLVAGPTREYMLMREINNSDIPEGLSSEYEWNN